MCVCVYVHVSAGARGLRKRVLYPLVLELKAFVTFVSFLDVGTGNPSSGLLREQHTLNHLSIPHMFYFLKYNSYNPGWSQTRSVPENSLEPLISVSVSRVLGL